MTARLIEVPEYSSEEWQAQRRNGLGASDIPSVMGVNPWQTEYQLWAVKRGLSDGKQTTWPMRFGHVIEKAGLDWWTDQTGLPLERGETWHHDRWPRCWATLDGRHERRGVEVKFTSRWETPPDHVRVQALAQCGIAELEAVDIVRLTGREEPTVFRIERDDALIADILDTAEAWWERFIVGGAEPAYDTSAEARRALARLRGEEQREASEYQRAIIDAWRAAIREREAAEAAEDRARTLLKASMAGAGRLVGPFGRVDWIAAKGARRTDWRSVAQGLSTRVTPEEWETVVELATSVGEPTDRLVPRWTEEEAS